MKKLPIVLLGLMAMTPATAETLKGGYPACVTEEAFDEYTQAWVREDERGMRYLQETHRCIVTRSGIEVSVLDRSWGTTKVRAYVGDAALVLWTNTENVVD